MIVGGNIAGFTRVMTTDDCTRDQQGRSAAGARARLHPSRCRRPAQPSQSPSWRAARRCTRCRRHDGDGSVLVWSRARRLGRRSAASWPCATSSCAIRAGERRRRRRRQRLGQDDAAAACCTALSPLTGGRRASERAVGAQAMIFQRPFMLRLSVWNNLRLGLWLARRAWPRAERHERAEMALRPGRPGGAARSAGAHAVRRRAAAPRAGPRLGRAPRRSCSWTSRPPISIRSAKKEVESLLAASPPRA